MSVVLHLADQPLNGFAAPNLHATPQRTQMASAIESRITRLEFSEEFYGRLIAGSISREATAQPGNIFSEATRGTGDTGEKAKKCRFLQNGVAHFWSLLAW